MRPPLENKLKTMVCVGQIVLGAPNKQHYLIGGKGMKQGQAVKWVDGMGFENTGVVDWKAIIYNEPIIPIRKRNGVIIRIERRYLEEITKS